MLSCNFRFVDPKPALETCRDCFVWYLAFLVAVLGLALEDVRGSDRSSRLASTVGNMLLYFPAVTMSKIFKRKVDHTVQVPVRVLGENTHVHKNKRIRVHKCKHKCKHKHNRKHRRSHNDTQSRDDFRSILVRLLQLFIVSAIVSVVLVLFVGGRVWVLTCDRGCWILCVLICTYEQG